MIWRFITFILMNCRQVIAVNFVIFKNRFDVWVFMELERRTLAIEMAKRLGLIP